MDRRGFTLIELLISITIIGMIMVIVMGAFRIGIRAWEKGDADINIQQRQQVVLELVKQQLASMSHSPVVDNEGKSYYFKADEQSVSFVSGISIVPANRYGKVLVQYRIRQQSGKENFILEIHEQSAALISREDNGFEPSDDSWHLLIDDMAAIEFEFLLKDKKQEIFEWYRIWSPDDIKKDLPAAVRLAFKADKDSPLMGIVARIMDEAVDS
jgi:general secretion pathway protein J